MLVAPNHAPILMLGAGTVNALFVNYYLALTVRRLKFESVQKINFGYLVTDRSSCEERYPLRASLVACRVSFCF